MHDIKLIRETPDVFDAAMARRGVDTRAADVLAIDAARRAKIQASEEAKAEQNAASKQVGAAKASGDEAEFERLRALVGAKKEDVARLNDEAKDLDGELTNLLMSLPNLLDASVPDGRTRTTTSRLKAGAPRVKRILPLLSITTFPPSLLVWILSWLRNCLVADLWCCQGPLHGCTARLRNLWLTTTLTPTGSARLGRPSWYAKT
jgi:seryl-tRNA synthetase